MSTQSAAQVTATHQSNAQVTARPASWAVKSTPAVNTQATISKAAGGPGAVHVCTGVSFGYVNDGTANGAAVSVLVNLRDGATGAGTILQSWRLRIPTTVDNQGMHIVVPNLSLVGSANTAMTLEFSGAAGDHTFAYVNLHGYTVS